MQCGVLAENCFGGLYAFAGIASSFYAKMSPFETELNN